jgi:hypothetical protein
MSTLAEIERAIQCLSPEDLETLRAWIEEFAAMQWDQQILQAAATGKLETLATEALEAYRADKATKL